jgi:hypothetical protein
MQRVSIRTLVLMLELLVAVVALQYMVMVRPARAGAIWLARDSTPAVQTPSEEIY